MDIKTSYGTLLDICAPSYYKDNILESCIVQGKSLLHTQYGELIPHYQEEDVRHKHIPSVVFYPNGNLKSISLEKAMNIDTPLGTIPGEFLTFHDNGTLKKIFPLNGKLSAYWTEEMEAALAKPLSFEFSFASFTKKIISLTFYKDYTLKSLTLFPGETIEVTTGLGIFIVKTGFSLHPDGTLKSFEPANPAKIQTPIGELRAFDPLSIGIHADANSLEFTETHQLKKLKTLNNIDVFNSIGEKVHTFSPLKKRSPLDDDIYFSLPLQLEFNKDSLTIEHDAKYSYKLSSHKFFISA
jgi:hypothetical protein